MLVFNTRKKAQLLQPGQIGNITVRLVRGAHQLVPRCRPKFVGQLRPTCHCSGAGTYNGFLCGCHRKAALQARLAREGARIAAAAGRQGERQEAAWGDATSDEDEAEVARYSRERGQILEVGFSLHLSHDLRQFRKSQPPSKLSNINVVLACRAWTS